MPKLTYLGHACFILEDEKHKIIFDPFLSGNPLSKTKPEDIKVEAVLVSHGHGDHLGDALNIAKSNNALIIAPFELAMYSQKKKDERSSDAYWRRLQFRFRQSKIDHCSSRLSRSG